MNHIVQKDFQCMSCKCTKTLAINKIIMEFQWLPQIGSFIHFSQVELEFGNVGFEGGRKIGVPGEKPLEQG